MRNRRLIQSGILAAALAVACLGVGVGTARADTIFTNLGSGGSFSGGAFSLGNFKGFNTVGGMPFTVSTTANLTDAILALGNQGGNNSAVTVDVESDNGGQPGTILAALTQQGTIPPGSSPGLVTFDCSGTCPQLTSGTPYWLVASEANPNSTQGWFFSNSDIGTSALNTSGSATGPWTLQPGSPISAFEIDGASPATPTPEPASWLLFGVGLLGVPTLLKRRAREA